MTTHDLQNEILRSLDKRGRESKTFVITAATMVLTALVSIAAVAASVEISGHYLAAKMAVDWYGMASFYLVVLGSISGAVVGYVLKTKGAETQTRIAAIHAGAAQPPSALDGAAP